MKNTLATIDSMLNRAMGEGDDRAAAVLRVIKEVATAEACASLNFLAELGTKTDAPQMQWSEKHEETAQRFGASETPRTDNFKRQGREWIPLGIFEDTERELIAVMKERDEARRKNTALNGIRNRMANAWNQQNAELFWKADEDASRYVEEWTPTLAVALTERDLARAENEQLRNELAALKTK